MCRHAVDVSRRLFDGDHFCDSELLTFDCYDGIRNLTLHWRLAPSCSLHRCDTALEKDCSDDQGIIHCSGLQSKHINRHLQYTQANYTALAVAERPHNAPSVTMLVL